MEISVRNDAKVVEIWLTRAESQDRALREGLKPLCQTYRAQSYLVAVFHSGGRDLEQRTGGLLSYNRKRAAELEVRRERARAAGTAAGS